jgi:hypothetical protein
MDKRYQVFVSSTYADLKEERRKVIQAVIEMDCIPAGMELFPAADEEQFQFIKRVIDDCDYYLLIIGGRYGSTTAEGISYTEKEFDYAVSRGLRVIALVHENPEDIPLGKSEKEPLLREKLQAFREKVTTDRIVKFWTSADVLPSLVTSSLAHTMKVYPAVGWIRANSVASVEVLTEINELRKANARLQLAAGTLSPKIENLAALNDKIKLYGSYRDTLYGTSKYWWVMLSWNEIFGSISPYMVKFPNDDYVKLILVNFAIAQASVSGYWDSPTLDDQVFRTVAVQLQALRLVNIQYLQTTEGGMGLFWSNTPSGERLMMELRTVKRVQAPELTKQQNG